jgi:putative methylase
MITKKKLAILLSKLKTNPKPRIDLEQYSIPGELAADILNIAYLAGDIKDKKVFDFGCGTGRLAVGAALLDAKEVIGIDIDEEVVKIARENVKLAEKLSKTKISGRIKFICMDITNWNKRANTIIQNPPFGIQAPGLDLLFLKKALECSKKIYSLHRGPTARRFLTSFIEKNNGKVEKIHTFKFKIPYMFKFHKKPKVSIHVDLYIIKGKR